MTSRAEEITALLRDEILRGQYRPGERLPSERDLAARFCANRGAVREALKKLEQLGIASVQPGGVRVVAIEEATLEVLGHIMDLTDVPNIRLVSEMLEVFGALLSMSARRAVKDASEAQLEQLVGLAEALIASHGTEEEGQCWRELSEAFNAITRNLVLRLIGNGLKTQFMGRLDPSAERQVKRATDRQLLLKLKDAIKRRDSRQTAELIQNHFDNIRGTFNSLVAGSTVSNHPETLTASADSWYATGPN